MLASDQGRASLFTIKEEKERGYNFSHALVDQMEGFVCNGLCGSMSYWFKKKG
jgi:hypothetical protein